MHRVAAPRRRAAAASTQRRGRPSASRIASTRAGDLGPGSARRPRPRAAGRAGGCRGDQTTGIGGSGGHAHQHPTDAAPASGRMRACRAPATSGSGSAPCRPGRPTPCSTSPGVGLGHATVAPRRARPARGARRRPHRRHRRCCSPRTPTAGRCPAGGAVLNGAGECTGFLTAARVGRGRDAGLPDLDDAARPGLRRRLRDRARAAPRRGRRRGDPGRRRVRRLVPQRLPPDAGDRRRRRAPPGARRWPRAARRRRPTRARSAPAPACPASASRAGSVRRRGSPPTATPSAVLLLTNFGVREELRRRRRPGRPAARAGHRPARTRPAGLLHRRRRHRRPGRRRRLRPAGPPDRARPGPHRLGRPPRQRRDLPRRSAPACGSTATARPDRTDLVAGRGARPAVRGGRRGRRGGGAQLDVHRADRPSAATATPASRCTRPAGARAAGGRPVDDRHAARGPDPDGRRRRAGRDAVPARPGAPDRSRACSRRCPTARTT